jgi:hypothetical protein
MRLTAGIPRPCRIPTAPATCHCWLLPHHLSMCSFWYRTASPTLAPHLPPGHASPAPTTWPHCRRLHWLLQRHHRYRPLRLNAPRQNPPPNRTFLKVAPPMLRLTRPHASGIHGSVTPCSVTLTGHDNLL